MKERKLLPSLSTNTDEAAVLVYTGPGCVACKATKRWLRNHDVAFDEIDVEEHPDVREQLLAEGFTSLPVVVIRPTDSTAVGFRPEFLKEELL